MAKKKINIYGGSLSSLVAADELSRGAGFEITLYLNPRGAANGFFGININGENVDIGFRTLSSGFNNKKLKDISEYDLNIEKTGLEKDFLWYVDNYLKGLLSEDMIIERNNFKMLFNGHITKDIYYTTDLSNIKKCLDKNTIEKIVHEAKINCDKNSGSGVFLRDFLGELNLKSASLMNHGDLFHRLFIESLCQKISEKSSSEYLAEYRRGVWSNLFYPLTIVEALSKSKLSYCPDRVFYYTKKGCMATFFKGILNRIKSCGGHIIEYNTINSAVLKKNKKTIVIDGKKNTIGKDDIIGLTPTELFPLLDDGFCLDKLNVNISWFKTKKRNINQGFDLLMIPEGYNLPYRVSMHESDSSLEDIIICFEAGGYLDSELMQKICIEVIEDISIVYDLSKIEHMKTLSCKSVIEPSVKNKKIFTSAKEIFKEFDLMFNIAGGASQFGALILSNQVVIGQYFADLRKRQLG